MIRWARIPAVYRAQRSYFFLHFSCTLLFMDEELASGTSNEISSSIFFPKIPHEINVENFRVMNQCSLRPLFIIRLRLVVAKY